MIYFLIFVNVVVLVYASFITYYALRVADQIFILEKEIDEHIDISLDALKVLNKVHGAIDTVSKYEVAENDPVIVRLVKTVANARDELKEFIARYTVINQDGVPNKKS